MPCQRWSMKAFDAMSKMEYESIETKGLNKPIK